MLLKEGPDSEGGMDKGLRVAVTDFVLPSYFGLSAFFPCPIFFYARSPTLFRVSRLFSGLSFSVAPDCLLFSFWSFFLRAVPVVFSPSCSIFVFLSV